MRVVPEGGTRNLATSKAAGGEKAAGHYFSGSVLHGGDGVTGGWCGSEAFHSRRCRDRGGDWPPLSVEVRLTAGGPVAADPARLREVLKIVAGSAPADHLDSYLPVDEDAGRRGTRAGGGQRPPGRP